MQVRCKVRIRRAPVSIGGSDGGSIVCVGAAAAEQEVAFRAGYDLIVPD